MADMNLFSGFQNALSGAGSGLISASKDVESYIQNIYQNAADDISEREKLFKNLVEKIGIAEDKGIKSILDRYEEFEKEAIALSSKEENRNQKKYSETLQQISLIQGTVQKALNKAFKDAGESTKNFINQIYQATNTQIATILNNAQNAGLPSGNIAKINKIAEKKAKEAERNQQRAFREMARALRNTTGAQYEKIRDAVINGLTTGAEGYVKNAYKVVSDIQSKYGINSKDLIQKFNSAFSRITKTPSGVDVVGINTKNLAGSLRSRNISNVSQNLAQQRIKKIYSGYSENIVKQMEEAFGAQQEEMFDLYKELYSLIDIAQQSGREVAINYNQTLKEMQVGFYKKGTNLSTGRNGAIDMRKIPSFKFSPGRLNQGLISYNGMTAPNDLMLTFDKDQKAIVTTTANLIFNGVKDTLQKVGDKSDEDLMYFLKKSVAESQRGASAEATKFFEKELMDGVSQGRIMNMGGRINVVPAFSKILSEMKKANIDIGTTSEYYDQRVFNDLFTMIGALSAAEGKIEKLKNRGEYKYFFQNDGISKMVEGIIRPLASLPLAVGQGSTSQINNGYIQLAANWQRAASFLPGDTSKHLSQTQNYETPYGGKRNKLPSPRFVTKAGLELGFDYEAPSEKLYNIQYITEEELLKKWDKWLGSKEGKKYLSRGGSKILPGLHGSASIFRDDLLDDFKSQRLRERRVSANQWYETQRKLGLSGKLDGLSEDERAKLIISDIMGVDIKNMRDVKFGQMGSEGTPDSTKDVAFSFNEIVDWMGNPKGLGAYTGTRSAMMPVPKNFIGKMFGRNIHMIRLAEEMGSNDFGGILVAAIEHELVNNKVSAKEAVEAFNENPELSGLFEVGNDGRLVLSGKMEKTRAINLKSMQKTLQDKFGIRFKSGLTISEPVNPSHDYFYQKETKYGQRELEAMRRAVSSAAQVSDTPEDFEEFWKHEENTVKSKGAEKAKALREVYGQAFRASFGSDELKDDIVDITSEYLSKDAKFAFNEDANLGKVDVESFANSALANIYEQIGKSQKGFGKIKLPEGFKVTHSDGFGKEWTMREIIVPMREHESQTSFFTDTEGNLGQVGVTLSQFDIALNRVIGSIQNYNSVISDSAHTQEDEAKAASRLNASLEDFYREDFKYFTSKDSQIVQDIYYNRVKGSHSFMAAGLNKAQRDSLLKSQDQNDRVLGKILDESYLIGPEAMRKIIGNNKYDVRAQYEHMFGAGTGKKMKVDDMLDAIIEAMTVENISNGKFKNIGLLSKNLRFPSIQGQDVRYMRGFVTNSLRGNMETAYIGSSGAAANRTDNDRDHVNIVSVARGMKGIKDQDKFFKSAEEVVKLHEAVSRNIRDVEATGGKINPEDIEFFGDDLKVTSEGLNKIAAFTALRNRGQIGLLSSQATEVRNFLSDVKFDENAGGRAAGLGQIVRYAFEKAEQDAISYKHVIKRLSEMGEKESGKTAEQAKEEDRKAYAKELEDKIRELQKAGKNEGVTSIDDLLNFREKLIESNGGQLPFPGEMISKIKELAATPGMERRLKEGRDTRVFDADDEKIIAASISAMTDLENVVSKAWKKEGGYTKTSDYLKELHRLGIFKDEINGVPFIQAMTQATMSGGKNFEDYVRELAKEYNVNADALLMSRDDKGALIAKEKLATMPFEMLVKMVDDAEETLSKNGKNILQRALVSKYRTAGDTSQSDYSLGKFLSEKISGANQIKDTDPETINKLARIKAKVSLGQKGRSSVEQTLVSMASMGASDEELITAIENIKEDKKKAKELSERLHRSAQQQVKEAKEKNDFSKVGFSNMQSDAPWQLFKANLRDPGHIYSEILPDLTSVDIGGPDKVKSASQLGGFFSGREYNATMRSADEAFNQILAKYTGTDFSITDLGLENYTPQDIKEFNDLRRKKIASDFGTIQHKEIEILGKLLENPPDGLKMDRFLQYNSGDTFESKIRSIIGSDSSFSESLQELADQRALAESNLSKFGYTKEDIEKFNNAALFSTLAQTMLVKKRNYKNVAREFSLGMKRDNLTGGQDYTAGTIDQIYYDQDNHRFVIGDSKNKSGADALSQVLQISYGATALKELIKKYREADASKKLDAFKKQYGINDDFAKAIQDVIDFGNEGNIGGIITKFSTKGGYVESLETNPLTDKETLDLLRRREAGDSSMSDQEKKKIEDLQKFVVGIDSRIFANDPSELNIFKYDEIIDNTYQNFIKALEKRANLQKRLYDLEQKGESGSAEYLSAQKEIENLEKNALAKDDDRYTSIAPTQLAQKKAADAEKVAKESVEAYKSDSAYNEVVKGISEERKLQSEIFKLNKQKSALQKEDAKANKATIKEIEEVVKYYKQSIDSIRSYRERLKELYGDKWNEDAGDGKPTKLKDIKTREKLTRLIGARDEKRLADAETNSATKEYIALLNQQLQLELKIKGFQRDAATSRGRQKELDLLAAEKYNEQLKETNKNLEKINKSKVKNIDSINAEHELKRNSTFASLYAKKPYSNIFEYIKTDISRATQRIAYYGIATRVLMAARREIQKFYQNILKLNEATTNLRIVTGANTEQAKSMMSVYNDLAMQLGTTTQAVAQSAAEWLRQGYSVSEANELIKSSTYLSRLGFMDMSQSVTALTSVMKGFRIEATDSMDIVDKLTQLDAKYATTAGDIATALSRTSAVARGAGLNLDQTAAALTTMIDVSQQDASSVGNAFRTILARYGNVKATAFTSLVGDSEDIDDANGSINDTEKVLGAIGIKIRSSSSDMRDFDDVMDELADKWVTLTDVEKNAVSTALAGVRQRNIFGIYMENYDTYKQAISEAEKAEGTAARKMQAYNESVAYSINQLSAAWEGFAQKLEASPAVKGGYKFLTFLVEQLDHILQYLTPLIAAFNADKIVSLAKFLSPLATAIPKAVGKGFKDRHGNGFYENMTQKMTAENTNAIKELTNSIKDNTAALRGEKSKGNNGGTNEENTNNKISKQQIRSARLKTGAAAGLAAGAVRLANKGASAFDNLDIMGWTPFKGAGDVEVSGGEAAAMGGIQAVLTAGLTAWLGPFGTVLATIGGDFLSSLWKKFAHADEIARKERVEEAKKQLEAIKGIGNSVTGLIDLNKKDQSLWDSDDWKQFNEQIETINEALKKSELGIIKLGNSTQTLSEYFAEAVRTGNKDMLARVEAEKIRFEAEKTYTAGEQDRYTIQKEINENQKKLASLDDDEISKKKELNAAIEAAKAEIEDYSEALKEGYMQASFYSSGVGTMESYDIGNATLDRVIMQIAREWAKDSPDIFAGNQLTSDARSDIISYLREQSGYSSLFKNDTKNVRDMLNVEEAVDNLRENLQMSQKQLKEFANSKDLLTIGKRFGLITEDITNINELSEADKSAVYKLIDKINLVDEDGISTIAHAMNMTVGQFREANSEGAFDWLTTDVAIGGLDKLNEKLATFNELLLAASENSLFSQENINKIVDQYPTLLKKIDEETKKVSVSMDNVRENLVDILAGGESLQKVYAGFFSRDIATSAEKWDVFISSIREDIEKDSALDGFRDEIFKQTNYSEFLKVYEEHKGELESYNQSFIEYAKSLFSTDIFDTQQEILTKYATSTLETEISNLESIRDSLDEVNKQREKEIELIKAKEALENASKEKKRVYRAGVGFVYTTDQEAVKSAQEKVDELERQRDKDDIQYQIGSLQQQKEILENIKDNEQLKALQETATDTLEALGVNGALVTAILSGSKEEFYAAIKSGLDKDIGDKATDVNNEIASEKERAYYEAKAQLEAFQQGKKFTGKFEQTNGVDDYSKPIYESLTEEDVAEYGGIGPNFLANMPYSPYYSVGKSKEETLLANVSSAAKEFKETNSNANIQSVSGIFSKTESRRMELANPWDKTTTGIFGLSSKVMGIPDEYQMNGSQNIKNLKYAIQDAAGTIGEWRSFNSNYTSLDEALSGEEVKGKNIVIVNMANDKMIYKDKDGQFWTMSGYDPHGSVWRDDGVANRDWTIWNKNNGFTMRYLMDPVLGQFVQIENNSDLKKYANYKRKWDNDKSVYVMEKVNDGSGYYLPYDRYKELLLSGTYASGTLSAPGGRSMINENGLESIITPSGTITSLPAKSGIVPADLTRNLWALGEVAPNLIARLGGNSLQTNNSNSVTDNSINISNLDATFYTEEGFDGEAFLRDLKSQVILTSNNH